MTQLSQSTQVKHALCYIPGAAFILFFIETDKSKQLLKHIKYGAGLFILYLILNLFVWIFHLAGVLSVMYIMVSVFLGYKAYIWEDIDLEWMDVIEDKIKKGFETK